MNREVIYEYENVLLGNKNTISSYHFNQSPDNNEKTAIEIVRYAVEHYLRWTPEYLCEALSWDIIRLLKLDSIIKYIRFPPEADEEKDLFIIAHKLYPHRIRVNLREKTLLVYKRVLDGTIYKFPKGFFGDNKGINRALICLQYALSQYTQFDDVGDMYAFFSTPRGTKFLKQYKLYAPCIAMYKYPIDYIHDALPNNVDRTQNLAAKDEFWYMYYRFKIANAEQIREMKKEGTFIA